MNIDKDKFGQMYLNRDGYKVVLRSKQGIKPNFYATMETVSEAFTAWYPVNINGQAVSPNVKSGLDLVKRL